VPHCYQRLSFHGEARSYYVQHEWLHIYFQERREREKRQRTALFDEGTVSRSDIADVAMGMLNLDGGPDAVR